MDSGGVDVAEAPVASARVPLSIMLLVAISLGCRSDTAPQVEPVATPVPPTPTGSVNVVLVSIDTLRADRLSVYGHRRDTSPNLRALAREAVVFEQVVNTGGGTLPVHMSMLTSLRPHAHNVLPSSRRPLSNRHRILAELLRAEGYRTAGFMDGDWMSVRYGFQRGFQTFYDGGGHFEQILPQVRRWLDRHHAEPFFLFIHTYDVHSDVRRLPYECPERYQDPYTRDYEGAFDGCVDDDCASLLLRSLNDEAQAGGRPAAAAFDEETLQYIQALYEGCINYVDAELGRVFAQLRELGVWSRTLLVITSDHGEEFLDHGRFLHPQNEYEEVARLPLLIKFPGGANGGTRVDGLVSVLDLMPTILDVVGLEPHPPAQGVSLLPLVRTGSPVRRDAYVWNALRTERWKAFAGRDELYDLAQDPHERRNVFAEHPDVVQQLRSRHRALLAEDAQRVQGVRAPAPVGLTDAETNRLRALGYLD